MKANSKRLLSALLAMVMVLSMLVIPAGAAGTGTKWDFLNNGTAEGFTDASFAGVTVDGEFQANYGAKLANGKTIVFPVDGACDIKVHVKHNWKIWINDDTANTEEYSAGGGDEVVTFHYNGAAGNVTLHTGTMSWVADITLAEYTTPAPKLELDKTSVRVKVGEGAATVNATVKNGTATNWEVTCADESFAKATVAGGVVTITPEAEGSTTVTVQATVDGADAPVTADITVVVEPAGEVVYTSWDFAAQGWTDDEKVTVQSKTATLRGLEIDATASGAKFEGKQLGNAQVQFNQNTIIKVPVKVPEGKKALVSLTSYAVGTISVDGVLNQKAREAEQFVCAGTDGWVTIKSEGKAYIIAIAVEYGEGELTPILDIDKTYLGLEMGKTESGEITVTKINTTAAVKAVSANTAVATATVNGDKVTITGVGAGETTVDISLDGVTETALNKKTVTVEVAAAGQVFYIAEGTYDFAGYTADTIGSIKGLDTHGAVPQDASVSHGLQEPGAGAGTSGTATGKIELTVNIPEGKTADLEFVTCTYGIGVNLLMESDTGEVTRAETSVDSATGLKFTVAGASGATNLTFHIPEGKDSEGKDWNKGIWIHTMSVLFGAQKEENRKIDIWDLTGQVVAGDKYQNNITPALWKSSGYAVNGVLSNGTTAEFGDFTLIHNTNDRLYSRAVENAADFGAGTDNSYGKWTYEDGYEPDGGVYCNGAGSATARYMQVKNVFPGDKLVAYLGSAQNGAVVINFEGMGSAAKQEMESHEIAVSTYEKLEFVAQEAGTYKIWSSGGGKPMYQRVMRYPGVPVTGAITLPAGYDGPAEYGIKFVNTTTKVATAATVKGNQFEVTLAPGYEYSAIMTGASGWGFTLGTKKVATAEDGGVGAGAGMTHDMAVEAKETYVFSGSFVGFAEGYDTSKLTVDLIPEEGSGSDEARLEITGKSFTATLDPEVEYTLVLSGVNDYVIKTPLTISSDKDDVTQNITVEAKELYTASGKFVIYDVDDQYAPLYTDSTYQALPATVTKLSFKNVEDGYTYDATVSGGGYTAKLRAGAYEAVATVDGYTTKGHVVVADKDAQKDLMFAPKATPAAVVYAADVYVGDASKSPNFNTVTGAMAYIKRMTRADDQRVTVHIAPGEYREQINIDSKNVTFVNADPSKEVKLTWYYGIGYKYYSTTGKSGTDSWYDVELAFDKFNKPDVGVARWGCTVRVEAPGFRAQDITFENSFNYYLTEEEIVDGVESNNTTIDFDREYGADVTSKGATERAAAIWVDTNSGRGDMTEFKNCKFLSSQDTFGTGSRMYVKDCYIEGMTDYICGPGNCVFDTCTLNWKGYSDKAQVAYLTAPQTGASEKGYLFRNCYISGDTKLKLTPNYLGRTWGGANTKCVFLNTTLQNDQMILDTTWYEMSSFDPANATNGTLQEWGTTLLDGTKVDLSKRTLQNTVAKSEPTVKPTDYFGDWTPYYYVEEDATVAFTVEPAITDNGDINTPYPGHTLTVNYSLGEKNDANDASVIQWVRVADNGAETVVKTSKANADKTYKITKDDQGAIIKVTVTPTTLGGKTGEAKSIALENKVREGFEDPTGATDPELGDGVNVFLAGDSTVFDYNGRNEGSWGEFLQNYLDKDLVTVVNHAVGGRSSRSFINEGRLDAIAANIKEGDFLLIQFGHNDCANEADYRAERYAPLGNPDASGKYPTTAGTKGSDGKYTWDNGGTFKWYLQQYIDVAKKAGATPILVTPVARLYYTADGAIRPHHDASYATNGSVTDPSKWDTTKDNTKYSNTYVTAVKQLAEENGIACIDGFQLTKDMYEAAYKACPDSDKATYGRQVMFSGDSTHSNKLGGMIQAALMAQAIKDLDVSISKTVKAPTMAQAKTTAGQTVFSVDGKGVFTAYDMLKDYGETAPYWMGVGQKLMDALKGASSDEPGDKTALNKAIAAAEAAAKATAVSEDGSDVSKSKKWVVQSVMDDYKAAIDAAKAVAAKQDATQAELDAAKTKLDAATADFKAAQKDGEKAVTSRPSGGGHIETTITTPVTTTVTNPDGTVATTTTDKDGNVDIAVKGEDGEVLAEVKLPATISAPATKFIDVPEGHWAEQSINNMAGLGMVKGVSENTYDMASPITRASVATIFFRLSNGTEGKSATFADVAENAWYADAIGWAANAKLINGYDETFFGPEDTITRQQLATMIARYARLLGMDTAANAVALDAFVDGAATDGWAVDSLAWCVKTGVIKGRGGDVLDPTAAVTRAEAAVMIDRMIGLLK